jgi:5-methylcytosine-specific restriction endonuclease McrA
LRCGEPTTGSYCPEHQPDRRSAASKVSARKRGYDNNHDKLSIRARRAQPFCGDCGRTDDLQCHHTEEAWLRKLRGQVIRLRDVEVLCGPCNRKRGSTRPGG